MHDKDKDLGLYAEADLIERLRQSRTHADAELLWSFYSPRILSINTRRLRNYALAEELTQEVFLRFWNHISAFRTGNFAAWLFTINRNAYRNYLARLPQATASQAGVAPSHAPEVEGMLLRKEVLTCLGLLSPAQRVVLKLLHIEGFTHREIAERTNMTLDEVRSNAQNGRRMLLRHWLRRNGKE